MATRSLALIPRLLALVAQFVTFAGFVVIVAGLATLQRTTNKLGGNIAPDVVSAYERTFSYALLTPYPSSHGFQFSFIWFIIFFECAILLFTLFLSLVPGMLRIGRPAALALLASAMTLAINVVNNLVFLHRDATAKSVYGSKDINVTLAGALLVVLGNGFTILTLGMWSVDETAPVAAHTYGTETKRDTVPTTTV